MSTNTTHHERRLERPRQGRLIGGVAAAVAHHLDIAVGVVRLGFLITAFAGGLGLMAYLTGVLLIPAEGEDRTPTRQRFDRSVEARSRPDRIAWATVTVAALILVSATGLIAAPLIFAAALAATGIASLDHEAKDGNA